MISQTCLILFGWKASSSLARLECVAGAEFAARAGAAAMPPRASAPTATAAAVRLRQNELERSVMSDGVAIVCKQCTNAKTRAGEHCRGRERLPLPSANP